MQVHVYIFLSNKVVKGVVVREFMFFFAIVVSDTIAV